MGAFDRARKLAPPGAQAKVSLRAYFMIQDESQPSEQTIVSPQSGGEIATPLVQELRPVPDVEAAFRALASRPHCVLLDSAMRHAELGRYSFLMADPFAYEEWPIDSPDPLKDMERRCAEFPTRIVGELPPFQGGAAGFLSYDLGSCLEVIPRARHDEFQIPLAAIGWYDVVLAWDHGAGKAWLISHGWPEKEESLRRLRAQQRMGEFQAWLKEPPQHHKTVVDRLTMDQLAPQFAMPNTTNARLPELTSSFSREAYLAAVQQAIDYIYAGDVFQVNIAQRLLYPDDCDPVGLYLRLRNRNPATFAGYFSGKNFQIASASPERFVRLQNGQLETRPIKGTRLRSRMPEADLFAGDELQASVKDRAENVMIVDLLRNDLSRVCEADSVRVRDLCRLEVYQTVQHLVSVVEGQLREDCSPIDVLRASFPGGSITGAPKVRAMEIIADLEPTVRAGAVPGSGLLGFDGTMDWNILIRTLSIAKGWRQLPVGGGIVAQSDPKAEYAETWHKAEGMLRALR